ncbi:MAG: hypothetical protein AAF602_32380 [Myxococcota bacterium]
MRFDPDPVFAGVATVVVVQAILTLTALSLGYTLALREGGAVALLAGFLLASALLSTSALAGVVRAARQETRTDARIEVLQAALAELTVRVAQQQAELSAAARAEDPPPMGVDDRERHEIPGRSSVAGEHGAGGPGPASTKETRAVSNRQL